MKIAWNLPWASAASRWIRNLRQNFLWIAGGGASAGLILMSCATGGRALVNTPSIPGASFVGSETCKECHGDILSNFHDRTHGKIITTGNKGLERGCEACHGPGSKHAESGGDKSLIKKGTSNCIACHQDVNARFNMASHHPIKEGAMDCTSCHDHHGDKRTTLSSTTRLCTSCHQDKQGPHVFEHPPVAENCTNCHNPHGSPIRKMLTASQPMLCLQCHSIAQNRHGHNAAGNGGGATVSGAALRNCTSCHGSIHGSTTDQHLRY
ncbi:MAG: cytochrome c3 family protein [Luteolibacter sp.]|jgi:predicted CXXCH cytochrome family protein|nr:cytochrome c3 family protein [Luteolibacter sp.]